MVKYCAHMHINSKLLKPFQEGEEGGIKIKRKCKAVLVVHACNSSYSGGTEEEDCSSKKARENSLRDPISKNPS
jgi:hypothetical protein